MSLKIEGDKDAVTLAGSQSPVLEEDSDSENEESLSQSVSESGKLSSHRDTSTANP